MNLKILKQADVDHYDIAKHKENQELVEQLRRIFQESKYDYPQMNSDLLEGAILSLIELHAIVYMLPYFKPEIIISLLIAFNIELLKEVQGISATDKDEFAEFEISETVN